MNDVHLSLCLRKKNVLFQHTAGQLRSRKTGSPGGAKVPEHGEVVTFSDVAGVDEAKEELEEIVVCWSLPLASEGVLCELLDVSKLKRRA